jgi:nucleoside-diphosphate-sugar epimerase
VDRLASLARLADAVIHTAFAHDTDYLQAVALDLALHQAFVEALAGSGKTIVVTNGTGGFGNTGTAIADEQTAVDLDYPLAARNRAEAVVTGAKGVRGIAIRLPLLVYGHAGSVFLPMLIAAARQHGISYYIGEGTNRMSTVHVDDVVWLFMLALQKGASGTVYLAASQEQVSLREVAQAIATGQGLPLQSITAEQAAEVWNPVWAQLLMLTNRVPERKPGGNLVGSQKPFRPCWKMSKKVLTVMLPHRICYEPGNPY